MTEFDFDPVNSTTFIIGQLAVTIVAIFLTGLAVRAWRNTRLKKMVFLIIAFALFGITHFLNYVDESLFYVMPDDARYAMFAIADIAIMLMFVFAIIKK